MTTNTENARKFALDLSKFAGRDIPEAVVAVHRNVTLDIFARLVEKSPVGNPDLWKATRYGLYNDRIKRRITKGYIGGSFRNFWQVYAGNDPGTGAPPPPKGQQARPVPGASDSTAATSGLLPFSKTYIVNGLPYSERLNKGWSSQAPAGFFELAIAEAVNQARAQLEPAK